MRFDKNFKSTYFFDSYITLAKFPSHVTWEPNVST